jgi:hypothetical protein
MTSKQLHTTFLVSLAILFIALIGGTLKVNSLLTSHARKLTDAKAKSLALDQERTNFDRAKREVITYADLQKITKKIVPEDKDQAETVRQIVNLAAANGVALESITFPQSSLGGAPTAASTAAKPASATPAASAQNNKLTALSQLIAAPNLPGVYSLNINVVSSTDHPVTYDQLISFLTALENNRRTAQVSAISLEPLSNNRFLLNFTLTLNEYIKP